MPDKNKKAIKFSVIVPALNEQLYIEACINSIHREFPEAEIIVVDAGSTDSTKEIAEHMGAEVLTFSACRGSQMNWGALHSTGDVLLFMHADSVLTPGCGNEAEIFFSDTDNNAAMFSMRFDIENYWLSFFSLLTRFNSHFTKFGDNGLILRRSLFFDCHLFPPWQLFEDVYFLKKLRKKTDIKIFNSIVITSSRRFIRTGVWKNQLRNISLFINYMLGMDITKISGKYQSAKYQYAEAIIIFARYPRTGKVKTRLAKNTSARLAKRIYRLCAENTFKECRKLPDKSIVRVIFYSDEYDRTPMMRWAGRKFYISLQIGEGLGERISSAFRIMFGAGFNKVVIIGTDNPELDVNILKESLSILEDKDIVIGPSNDGGYYLLGMKKFYSHLFEGIQWSSESVLQNTLNKIPESGLSVGFTNTLTDIDTVEDIKELIKSGSDNIPVRLRNVMKSVVQ